MKTLVINPGSTSTKVAVFEDDKELTRQNLSHSREELAKYPTIVDQLDYRYGLVMDFLKGAGYTAADLDCVMSRGGSPPNIRSGCTAVDERLIDALKNRPLEPHPACVGPVIADKIAKEAGIPAYVYDPVTSDELDPLAKVYGVKGIEHNSMCHFLKTHAMAIAYAKKIGKNFEDVNVIVSHIGGGSSICLWSHGRAIDTVPGDAGTFSAERAGFMRSEKMVQLVEKYGAKECVGWLHGKGGMVSLLGTNDLRDVEKMIQDGDEYALKVTRAMAYQLAKNICSLLPVVEGKLDGIVITGGGAYWERLTDDITARLKFLNIPVSIQPGENEMQALAEGALRVMRGEEQARAYEG